MYAKTYLANFEIHCCYWIFLSSPEELLLRYRGLWIDHNIHTCHPEKIKYWYTTLLTQEHKYTVFKKQKLIIRYNKASKYINSWFYSKIENHIAEFKTLEGFGHLQKKSECNQLFSFYRQPKKRQIENWSRHTVHEVKGRNIMWEVVHSILLSHLGHTTQKIIRKTTLYYAWVYYFTFICQPNPEQSKSVRPREGRSLYLLSNPTSKLYLPSHWHHLNNCHREKSNSSTWFLSLEVCSCLLIINRSW